MGLVRFPDTRASKPMTAEIFQSATGGTYYTILDITSGSGFLQRLITTNSYSTSANIVDFRITIDGIQQTISPFGAFAASPAEEFEIFSNSRFNFSLKIEARNNTGSTYNIAAGCDYVLEI